MLLSRPPIPRLRPFVEAVWVTSDTDGSRAPSCDRVLPTGAPHLVFRLTDEPLRIRAGEVRSEQRVSGAVVGGPRSRPYDRYSSRPSRSVGVQLRPGVAPLLLGIPASEIAEQHVPLSEFWGAAANLLRDRLLEVEDVPEQPLQVVESVLAERFASVRGVHPVVAHALQQFAVTGDVHSVVKQSGYSHRRFIAVFRQATGLTPKLYCRLVRFQNVISRITTEPTVSGVELALSSGHSDQSHLNREFRRFAGVSPGRYRQMAPRRPNHLRLRG